MNSNKENFVKEYINCIVRMSEAMSKNDYKTNNKYVSKLNKLHKKYENENYYKNVLLELIGNSDLNIASMAASDSLKHSCNINKAVLLLKKVSEMKNIGILSFSAEGALKIWRGEWPKK